MMIDDLRAAAEADVVLIHFNYNFSKMLHSRNQPLMHKSRVQRITAYINKSRLWLFKLHWKWQKGFTISSCCFLGNDTQKWFLTNWAWDNNTQRFHKKYYCSLSKIMNKKQVLVYGLLESTNGLRSIFVENIHFKKLMIFQKFIELFHCCMTRLKNEK